MVCLGALPGRERKMRTNFFCTNFLNAPTGPGHPGKIPGTSQILSSKPKEDKLSRESTNFSATTPSRGRPPPHRAVSRPKKFVFVLFFFLPDTWKGKDWGVWRVV